MDLLVGSPCPTKLSKQVQLTQVAVRFSTLSEAPDQYQFINTDPVLHWFRVCRRATRRAESMPLQPCRSLPPTSSPPGTNLECAQVHPVHFYSALELTQMHSCFYEPLYSVYCVCIKVGMSMSTFWRIVHERTLHRNFSE